MWAWAFIPNFAESEESWKKAIPAIWQEAALTEGQGRALSGHKTAQAYRGYAKETFDRALSATRKRHAHRLANTQSTSVQNEGQIRVQNEAEEQKAHASATLTGLRTHRVRIEPVSVRWSLLTGKNTGKLIRTGRLRREQRPKSANSARVSPAIPWPTEQGIVGVKAGKSFSKTGNFLFILALPLPVL
jgi:hypothetical protein